MKVKKAALHVEAQAGHRPTRPPYPIQRSDRMYPLLVHRIMWFLKMTEMEISKEEV